MPAFPGGGRWTGKAGKVYIGTYEIADLQEWSLELTQRNVETTALSDDYTVRIALDHDYRVTIRKWMSARGTVRVAMGVVDPRPGLSAGQTLQVQLQFDSSNPIVFDAPMLLDRASISWPDGGSTEDINLVLADAPSIIPSIE